MKVSSKQPRLHETLPQIRHTQAHMHTRTLNSPNSPFDAEIDYYKVEILSLWLTKDPCSVSSIPVEPAVAGTQNTITVHHYLDGTEAATPAPGLTCCSNKVHMHSLTSLCLYT